MRTSFPVIGKHLYSVAKTSLFDTRGESHHYLQLTHGDIIMYVSCFVSSSCHVFVVDLTVPFLPPPPRQSMLYRSRLRRGISLEVIFEEEYLRSGQPWAAEPRSRSPDRPPYRAPSLMTLNEHGYVKYADVRMYVPDTVGGCLMLGSCRQYLDIYGDDLFHNFV